MAMIHHTRSILFTLTLSVLYGSAGIAEDWWQFRGPNAGHVAEKDVPTHWGGSAQAPLWQTRIPGKGWSSPIVIGDRIWLTSAEEVAMGSIEVAKKLAELPFGSRDIVADASVALFAIELNAVTGEILRRIDLFESKDPQPIHAMNSYASPTPVSDGASVICHFGALGTACLDMATGDVLWKRVLTLDELTGGGASPVVWGSNLYLACDGADQQYITAIDKLTGETKWKVNRPPITVVDDSQRRAFSTPLIVETQGRTQLISLAAQWLVSYNPEDGREWWRAKVGTGYSLVPSPVYDRDRVFVCTGFTSPEMVAVNTNGTGDVSDTAILWRYTRQVPDVTSPLVVDSEVYFISSNGIATCLDAANGAMIWQHRVGGNFAASPTFSDGRIYMTSSGGITTVIKPGRQYVELATNELFGETYASLAVYQKSFLLRTNPLLFRLGNSN
jgi:outer membrane protein assembly factor BamB